MDFLPLIITWFMNFASVTFPNFGSGRISRFAATRLLGMISPLRSSGQSEHLSQQISPALLLSCVVKKLFLRTFCTVLRTGLFTVRNTGSIQGSANCVVTHTRQVFNTTATDQHNTVFLQVVAFTADVGSNFETIRQTHTAHFTQSRVRLFRSGGIYTGTYATTLRTGLQGRNVTLSHFALTRLTNQLVDCSHLANSNLFNTTPENSDAIKGAGRIILPPPIVKPLIV